MQQSHSISDLLVVALIFLGHANIPISWRAEKEGVRVAGQPEVTVPWKALCYYSCYCCLMMVASTIG